MVSITIKHTDKQIEAMKATSTKKTDKQIEAIKATSTNVLVRGVPGSGKTVVLVEKVKSILEETPNAKILFITYNNTLKAYIHSQLKDTPYKANQLKITTYHSWAKEALSEVMSLGKNQFTFIDNTFSSMYRNFPSSSRYFTDQSYENYLKEEWKWLKGKEIKSEEEYLNVERTGRGVGINKAARKEIYSFFQQVEHVLASRNLVPLHYYGMMAIEYADKIKKAFGYTHVFIDEAQDLTQAEVHSLSSIIGDGAQLVIAADLGQKIYKTDFTWRSAGVNVQGGRTKTLDIAHRSTKQVMDLAASLLAHDPLVKTEEEGRPQNVVREGNKPLLVRTSNENQAVVEIAQSITEVHPDARIGVLSYTNYVAGSFERVLREAGLQAEKVDKDGGNLYEPGVKLMTMHSAKGLEFDYVIITGISDRFPSFSNVLEDEREEHTNAMRRLLYVSMTRARNDLFIVYSGVPSAFVREFNENYYVEQSM